MHAACMSFMLMAASKLTAKLLNAALKGDCKRIQQLLDDNSSLAESAIHLPDRTVHAPPLIGAVASGSSEAGALLECFERSSW